MIFNEGELGDSIEEFNRYREKVVDRELELAPSVNEIIELGFKKNDDVAKEVLRQLEVDNIRAVQKIEKFLDRLEPSISHLSQKVRSEVVKSAVRLSWFYFVRDRSNIPWDFIKRYDNYGPYLGMGSNRDEKAPNVQGDEQSRRERAYAIRLKELGHLPAGPLERTLIDALEKGYHNRPQFEEILSNLDEKLKAKEAVRKLDDTWDLFHSSFDDMEEEFVQELIQRFKTDSQYFPPTLWRVLKRS